MSGKLSGLGKVWSISKLYSSESINNKAEKAATLKCTQLLKK